MKKIVKSSLVCAVSVLFLAAAIGSGTDKDKETAGKIGEVSSQSSSENDKNNENSGEKADEKDAKTEFKVGDTLETKSLNITYLSSGDYISDNEFLQPAEGKKYIFAEFYCENVSDSDKNISNYDFKCFADGYASEAFYGGDDELSATLSQGRTTTGKVYFEVPSDAKDIEIEYETNLWTEEKIKFVFEGDKSSGIVPENKSTASENAFKVGDIVKSDKLVISYLSCGEYISDNEFIQPKEGNHYIYCEFEVENVSDSDQNISVYDFDCYADGKSCESNYSIDNELSATLSAGRKAKGKVSFEVPINAENVEIECLLNFWNSNRIVFTYSDQWI